MNSNKDHATKDKFELFCSLHVCVYIVTLANAHNMLPLVQLVGSGESTDDGDVHNSSADVT